MVHTGKYFLLRYIAAPLFFCVCTLLQRAEIQFFSTHSKMKKKTLKKSKMKFLNNNNDINLKYISWSCATKPRKKKKKNVNKRTTNFLLKKKKKLIFAFKHLTKKKLLNLFYHSLYTRRSLVVNRRNVGRACK